LLNKSINFFQNKKSFAWVSLEVTKNVWPQNSGSDTDLLLFGGGVHVCVCWGEAGSHGLKSHGTL